MYQDLNLPKVKYLTLPPTGQDIVPRGADAVPDQEVPIVHKTQLRIDPGDGPMIPKEVPQVPATATIVTAAVAAAASTAVDSCPIATTT